MARSKAEKVGLPEELIIDILLRLPPKSVGLFRCVSMHWCNVLSDPKFIKSHISNHAHNIQEKLICISHSHSLHTITFNPQNGNDGFSRNLHFQQLSDNWDRIVGSCNGLVLVEDKENFQFLVNPTTLKYHKIPNFCLALPKDDSFSKSGLGYDVVSDDYKVVTLSLYDDDGYELTIESTFVDVYSVRKGHWTRLEILLPYSLFLNNGVFVDGALHWLVKKCSHDSFMIIAFNLKEEKFLEVPTLMDNYAMGYNLFAFAGCLCMCSDAEEDKNVAWMMKEYGVKESWTKFTVRGPKMVFDFLPLCLMSDDDVVLDVYDEKLTVYNMKEDQWRDMIVDGITAKFLQTATFTDSLVSPIFG